jgi:putative endonuclease
MDTKDLGNLGEDLACEYLVSNGYKILGRNCRIKFGEIDIIAKKRDALGEVIHFIEVKALSCKNTFYPEEHVNYRKQQKLARLAEIWMSKNNLFENISYQIDVVAVSPGDKNTKIDFFENVVEG